jgi:two-component system, sensor histidine kinase
MVTKLIKVSQDKDIFFASMSHELRNPLNCIVGCIEILLQSSTLNDRETLNVAKVSSETLINLIGKQNLNILNSVRKHS